jgi:hypothetical protein
MKYCHVTVTYVLHLLEQEAATMSDSDSDESVGLRAARDRFQTGTQEDYQGALNQMEDYVKENYDRGSDIYERCMTRFDKLKMPADFAISKLFIRDHVQNRFVPWPDDNRETARKTHMKHLSLSTMTTVVSAMKYSYTRIRRAIPADVSTDLMDLMMEMPGKFGVCSCRNDGASSGNVHANGHSKLRHIAL